MRAAFSLDRDDTVLDVLITDSIPGTYIIQLQGKLEDSGISAMSEALDKLMSYDLSNIIIDFSKITIIPTVGWNYLIKLKSLLSAKNSELLFMRMPPTVYEQFSSFSLNAEFKHYRTFGEIIRLLIEKEQQESKSSKYSYEGLHASEKVNPAPEKKEPPQNVFSHEEVEEYVTIEDSPAPGDFPLAKSRKAYPGDKVKNKSNESAIKAVEESINSFSPQQEANIPEKLIAIRGKLRSLFEMKIYEWKSRGFDTTYLDGFLDKTLDETKKAFSLFSERMAECTRYKELLASRDTYGMEKLVLAFTQRLYNPMDIDNIRADYDTLIKALQKTKDNSMNPLFGYQFTNFIKGESNRESYDMAYYLSDNLQGHERPVYIVGPNGSGKTHILSAAGNKIREECHKVIHYITSLDFIKEFESYRAKDDLGRFREKYTDCDILLFDDLHHLAHRTDAAVEFSLLYEKAQHSGIHVFTASTSMPDELMSLSKDLVSRLNNSIFLTLNNPDIRTMTEIVRSRFNILEIPLKGNIPGMIADLSSNNIRKALGYISTLALYHETYGDKITTDIVLSLIVPDTEKYDFEKADIRKRTKLNYPLQQKKYRLKILIQKSGFQPKNNHLLSAKVPPSHNRLIWKPS